MRDNKNYDELEELTALDDMSVEEIAYEHPFLDDSAKNRIKALCERKMKMNSNFNDNEKRTNTPETNEEIIYNENAEHIKHIPWYRRPIAAIAAALIVIVGAGGAIMAGNSRPEPDNDPVSMPEYEGKTTTTITAESIDADTTAENEQDEASGNETSTTAVSDNSNEQGGGAGTSGEGGFVWEDDETPSSAEQPSENETPSEAEEPSAEKLYVNGYNVYDYPEYVNWIKGYADRGENDYTFTLYDLNGDGYPEQIMYWTSGNVRTIHDGKLMANGGGSLTRSNYTCSSSICENGVVMFRQGNPPYDEITYFKYNGDGMLDRIECITEGVDNPNVEYVDESDPRAASVKSYYHFVLDGDQRIGTDSYAQYDLGLEPSEDTMITLDEANAIKSKYVSIDDQLEKISVTEVK